MMLRSPYVYAGGKSKISSMVWNRFGGNIQHYIEPFFGSGAMLLARPGWRTLIDWVETVNDKDAFISNFYRAIKSDPDSVASYAYWPTNENDLHARHIWLVSQKTSLMRHQIEGDPEWCDAKIAGWWVWGMSLWIGGGFCSGDGPWTSIGGDLVKMVPQEQDKQDGVSRKIKGIKRQRPQLVNKYGIGRYFNESSLKIYLRELSERLQYVRVCCGDWERVVSPALRASHSGFCGIFLDPPYSAESGRCSGLYSEDSLSVAHDVRKWCIENGSDPKLKIVLCGYQGEHEEMINYGWSCEKWIAQGGLGNLGGKNSENRFKEIVWFSPSCNSAKGFGV